MNDLPNPTSDQVALWLKNGLNRDFLHQAGWREANRRFHGITRAARSYIQANYAIPQEQEAAFDGLTLALNALGHFADIDQLQKLLDTAKTASSSQPTTLP